MRANIAVLVMKFFPVVTGVKLIVFIAIADDELCRPVMYTFWDESTAILSKRSVLVPLKYVYETSVPDELYLKVNISSPVDIGKVFPEDVGVKLIVFIAIAAVPAVYRPPMYTFRDESTTILLPIVRPDPAKYVYELSVPAEYLRTNILPDVDIGKVFPEDVGVGAIVFIVTADAELYRPVMYTFRDESTAILSPESAVPVPDKYV